ncbi:MAG: radical SAM protein [Desulfobacterales bacterium]|nr:radical SAM protein [Desulfobacterales bacterium]
MLERIESQKKLTQTIHLTLTRECNIACTYCKPETDEPCRELSTSEWKEMVDQLTDEYGPSCIIVKGGEPLIREDFFDIISHIKSKGHIISLVTNGTMITDETMARKLENYVDHMEVSLDGVSPETTDCLKGEGVFDRIMTGVDLVRQTRVQLGLSFVILEENQHILWDNLEVFMKERVGEETAIRIDNRMSFPVDYSRESGDYFDFLRAADKLACHGRIGDTSSATALEIDPGGHLHTLSSSGQGTKAI